MRTPRSLVPTTAVSPFAGQMGQSPTVQELSD